MGVFVCLMTVLLVGFIIGRGSRDEEAADQIYLNNPGSTRPTPSNGALAGQVERAPLTRVARPSALPDVPVDRRPRPTHDADTKPGGSGDDGPSRYLLNGNGDDDATTTSALGAMEREVVRLINIERRRAGCGPLRIDRRLILSARRHSAGMASAGNLSHTSPDGTSPWERMDATGYRDGGAENIGRGYTSPDEAVRNWMETSGHRRNILNCELTATGVGAVQGPDGPWWTQDFGYS